MTANIRLGRIAGIEISLNWSVLVLFVLLVWTLASGVFPATNPGLSHRTDLVMAVAATVGYVLALLLHELGHALQARRDGMEIDGITLWLFGGVATFRSAFAEAGVELRVALAGPLVSLLLGVIAVLVALANLPEPVGAVFAWLGYINLSLFIVNMLPALPLDGGRVLHALLWKIKGDEANATRVAAISSRVNGYLLVTAGLFLLVFLNSYSAAWLVFLGWFLIEAAAAGESESRARQALTGLRVADVMTPDPVTVAPDLTVERLMETTSGGRRYTTYPVVEDDDAVGLLPFSRAARLPRRRWHDARVRDVMLRLDEVPVLAADDSALDALAAVSGSEAAHALVVADGRLAGLLSITDLKRVLEAAPRDERRVALRS